MRFVRSMGLTGLSFAGLLLAMTLVACSAGPTVESETPSVSVDKADARDDVRNAVQTAEERAIEVTKLEDFVPHEALLQEPQQRVVSTADAFERFFDVTAPSQIDFSRQWVVFYTPGPQTSAGYQANIEVSKHDSGRSLRIRRELMTPGLGCVNASMIYHPYFVGVFDAPSNMRPQSVRYYSRRETKDCSASALCGDELLAALDQANNEPDGEELLYMSEADYPFVPVNLGSIGAGEISAREVAKRAMATGGWAEALTWFADDVDGLEPGDHDRILDLIMSNGGRYFRHSEGDYDGYFGWARSDFNEEELQDDYYADAIAAYESMNEAMNANLTDVRVFRFFDVEVHILIVGRSSCGELIGYETISIET